MYNSHLVILSKVMNTMCLNWKLPCMVYNKLHDLGKIGLTPTSSTMVSTEAAMIPLSMSNKARENVADRIYTINLMLEDFRTVMKKEFEMTDLRLMKYFLGLEVTQTDKGIFIRQHKYAIDIL